MVDIVLKGPEQSDKDNFFIPVSYILDLVRSAYTLSPIIIHSKYLLGLTYPISRKFAKHINQYYSSMSIKMIGKPKFPNNYLCFSFRL